MKTFQYFLEIPKDIQRNALLVQVPKQIKKKIVLLEHIARSLRFPSYFNQNWDSFDECLSDLSWLQVKTVVLWHQDIPLQADLVQRRKYLEVLNDIINEDTMVSIIAIFPPENQNAIETELNASQI